MDIYYTLRYSKKAKYLQLRISKNGLEVVIPFKQSISDVHIHDFIRKKNDWIIKTRQRHISRIIPPYSKCILPKRLDLLAMNQVWEIGYIPTLQRKLSLHVNPARQIKLIGDTLNEEAGFVLLKKWIKETAKIHLYRLLKEISDELAMPFNELSIRNNMTRWGSCSSQKNINLCCRLLFLPIHLVRHVILHELCHTQFMHHGKLFWDLLEKLDANTDLHRLELKKSSVWIPEWMYVNKSQK